MKTIHNDYAFMAKALRLAGKGLYTTRTNPRVGCVIVKDGQIISSGFHISPGLPHAEIMALQSKLESVKNSTVYVTLEPCSHQGKTPPCVDTLVAAKVARVVAAITDPNPLVNGKGIAFLQNHGVKTTINILNTEAAELNKGFVKRMTNNLPYVTVKSAISIDGKTALKSGESKWISCDKSRLDVQKLRARSCAMLTGIDTILADDPSLTVRLNKNELGIDGVFQQPKRIILDTQLRIPLNAKVLKSPSDVIIYTCLDDSEKSAVLRKQNIEIVSSNMVNNSIDLNQVMSDLAKRGFNEVLVEAGSTLVGSLLDNKLIDEMVIYMAPHILGNDSLGLAKIIPVQSMQDRLHFTIDQTRKIGSDLKLIIKPKY
jgi:diaminohydroxyphosphoribosylaminopyrimidine deaminase/5-amino-6-(5-phosphoribosylamino)uracil reductase